MIVYVVSLARFPVHWASLTVSPIWGPVSDTDLQWQTLYRRIYNTCIAVVTLQLCYSLLYLPFIFLFNDRVLIHFTLLQALKILFCTLFRKIVFLPFLKSFSDVFTIYSSTRLGKSYEEVQFHERERTKRIVYSVIYGVGKKHPVFDSWYIPPF